MFGTIRSPNAEIRPVVTGILPVIHILIEYPVAFRGPTVTEVQMIGLTRDQQPIGAIQATGENPVTVRLGAGQVKSQALPIRADVGAVREALSGTYDFDLICPI